MKLSVAMPYWNRASELECSLASYRKVYPHHDIEFCICDDGSVPPLLMPGAKVTYLPQKSVAKCPVTPINVAVRNCTNDIIVLTNPEIEHREPVLDQMLSAWTGPDDYVMAGCRDTVRGEWYAGAGRSMKGCLAPPEGWYHFCVLFHCSLFERVGGFDEDYREGHAFDDNDFLFRLWALGDVNYKYVPGVVWHNRRLMQRSIWKGPQLLRNEKLLRQKWGHLGKEFVRAA